MNESPTPSSGASSSSSSSIREAAHLAELQLARALARVAVLDWTRAQVRAGSKLTRLELLAAAAWASRSLAEQELAETLLRAGACPGASQGSARP